MNPSDGMTGGYAVTYAADCAIRYFMQLNGFVFQYHFDSAEERQSYQEAYNDEYEIMREELYRGGYQIYTSIDREKQALIQVSVDDFLTETRTEDSSDLQAAVVLSNKVGQVMAVIGGETGLISLSDNPEAPFNRL